MLVINRANAYEDFGGDVVQMERTVHHLQGIGVDVEVRLGDQQAESLAGFDLVHLFNLQTPAFTRSQLEIALSAGKRVAVSTIWWDFYPDEHLIGVPRWIEIRQRLGYRAALCLFQMRHGRRIARERQDHRKILQGAHVLLPNSVSEVAELRRLGPFTTPVHVVPNGIEPDPALDDDGAKALLQQHGLESGKFILVAGRVELIKNQLEFTLAVRDIGLPVVCAGGIREPYGSHCRDAGAILLGRLEQPVLHALCRHAALHALPSFRETPGLASLEAAALGCRIVSTSKGSARDYFGRQAHYCDPYSKRSMRRATLSALAHPVAPSLAVRVKTDFTWRRAAEETLAGYRMALA